MAKRNPKKGYVYLLENIAESEDRIYKYGCTTLDPVKRCQKINSNNKKYGYEFKVIAAFKSFDIYADEHKVRCDILDYEIGRLNEIFTVHEDSGMPTTQDVIQKFLTIGGVLYYEKRICGKIVNIGG